MKLRHFQLIISFVLINSRFYLTRNLIIIKSLWIFLVFLTWTGRALWWYWTGKINRHENNRMIGKWVPYALSVSWYYLHHSAIIGEIAKTYREVQVILMSIVFQSFRRNFANLWLLSSLRRYNGLTSKMAPAKWRIIEIINNNKKKKRSKHHA